MELHFFVVNKAKDTDDLIQFFMGKEIEFQL